MSLEEIDRIDFIAKDDKGNVILLIVDTSENLDEKRRYELLNRKLRMYMGYIKSNEFLKHHPGKTTNDVKIVITCYKPPSPQMRGIKAISAVGDDHIVEVEFKHIPMA